MENEAPSSTGSARPAAASACLWLYQNMKGGKYSLILIPWARDSSLVKSARCQSRYLLEGERNK